jgi:hypothetical protein
MLRRIRKSAWWLCLALLGNIALAQQSYQLNVSAEVPPRLCQYPEICEPVQADVATKVTIEGGEVHYVGSPPQVTQSDDLMTVLF